MYRSISQIKFKSCCLTHGNSNIIRSGDLKTLKLMDKMDVDVASFHFAHGKISNYCCHAKEYKIVKDTCIDRFKKRFFNAFLGYKFDTCQLQYVVIKGKKIIAQVYEDRLNDDIRFVCNDISYSWDTFEVVPNDEVNNSTEESDSSQFLCFDIHDCFASQHTSYKPLHRSFDLMRKSTPF